MIDIQLYRFRIGCYNGNRVHKMKLDNLEGYRFSEDPETKHFEESLVINPNIYSNILVFLTISLFILSFLILYISHDISYMSHITNTSINTHHTVHPDMLNYKNFRYLPFLSIIYSKIAYSLVMLKVFMKILVGGYLNSHRYTKHGISSLLFPRHKSTMLTRCGTLLLIALLILNFLLIAVVNPSLLNPGPLNLSVSYQNVRGLVPFSCLGNPHPNLDRTKICEVNSHLAEKKPSVLLLSETWLKKSIKDSEVIENKNYNVYRTDKSQLSHPSDPTDPNKLGVGYS